MPRTVLMIVSEAALDAAKIAAIVAISQILVAMILGPAAFHWLDKRYARLEELNRWGAKVNRIAEEKAGLASRIGKQENDIARTTERMEDMHRYIERELVAPIRSMNDRQQAMGEEMVAIRTRLDIYFQREKGGAK